MASDCAIVLGQPCQEPPMISLNANSPHSARLRHALFAVCAPWGLALWAISAPVSADPQKIGQMLQLEALFGVLQQEGVTYGADLFEEIMATEADADWRAEVAAIHAPDRLLPEFERAFSSALTGADQQAILDWLASPLGQRVTTLELETRRDLLDPEATERATARLGVADVAGDPRLAAVRRVIAATDLVDENVVGGMNSDLALYRALSAGGAFPYELAEADMLGDIAGQEPAIRADVTSWIESYLFAAYQPLTVAEIDSLAVFGRSGPGQSLFRAEFEAFDKVFAATSGALGAALAQRMTEAEL